MIKIFNPEDVFNADEFGHFYSNVTDRTISREVLPVRIKYKIRRIYLVFLMRPVRRGYPSCASERDRSPYASKLKPVTSSFSTATLTVEPG